MVCIYCSNKTQVSNSRLQRRANQVWRRRQCLACQAVFTTEETADYTAAWTVESQNGSLNPFMRDKLFLSLYKSLQHRPAAAKDAAALTDTVIKKLLPAATDGRIRSSQISQVVQVALARFDKAASTHYQAFHA